MHTPEMRMEELRRLALRTAAFAQKNEHWPTVCRVSLTIEKTGMFRALAMEQRDNVTTEIITRMMGEAYVKAK